MLVFLYYTQKATMISPNTIEFTPINIYKMRVIRSGGLAAVAGEMLNIEMGRYFFTPEGPNLINDAQYPQFPMGGAGSDCIGYLDTILGTVIITQPINTVELKAVYNMLKKDIPKEMLTRVHVEKRDCHQVVVSNVSVGKWSGGFTWTFKYLSNISTGFDEGFGVNLLTVDYIASVLYDPKSITTFADNELTFAFNRTNLNGNKYISGLDLIICNLTNPLEIEMSAHWSKVATSSKVMLINTPVDKVFACEIDQVKWATCTTNCTRCRSDIYGEFYGLSHEIYKPICWAFCALCVHNGEPFDEPLERQFSIICRFNSGREYTGGRKSDLLREFHQRLVPRGEFTLIGSRYVGVLNIEKYIYSDLCRDPEFDGRLICALNHINL